jgi:ribosomal protein L37AE/L43A
MQQEDYNSMMRYPWERVEKPKIEWPKCPSCGEEYSGDGITECVECKNNEVRNECYRMETN